MNYDRDSQLLEQVQFVCLAQLGQHESALLATRQALPAKDKPFLRAVNNLLQHVKGLTPYQQKQR